MTESETGREITPEEKAELDRVFQNSAPPLPDVTAPPQETAVERGLTDFFEKVTDEAAPLDIAKAAIANAERYHPRSFMGLPYRGLTDSEDRTMIMEIQATPEAADLAVIEARIRQGDTGWETSVHAARTKLLVLVDVTIERWLRGDDA